MAQDGAHEIVDLARQTGKFSSLALMRQTPAYQALLASGRAAVPLLLAALNADQVAIPAMALLGEITGADPVPEADRGDIDKMVQHWRSWADGAFVK